MRVPVVLLVALATVLVSACSDDHDDESSFRVMEVTAEQRGPCSPPRLRGVDGRCFALGEKIIGHEGVKTAKVVTSMVPGDERPGVVIELTPKAAARLDRYSAEHRGSTVAIVAGQSVVAAQTLNGLPFGGSLALASETRQEADRVVASATRH